jgi:hypothetical protein
MRMLAISVVSLCLATPLTAQNTAIAFDSTNHIVATLDLTRGTIDSKVDVPLAAVSRVALSPDNRTLLAVNNGGLRTTGMFSVDLHPDKKGSWALLSGDKVIGKGDLGWGLAGSAFAADGKSAYLLTTGDDTKKPADLKPSELVRIDAVTGTESGRLSFDRSASALGFDRSGSTAMVSSPAQSKRTPPLPAQLIFIDLKGWKQTAAIDIPGKPEAPAAVGNVFYFVDPGEKKSPGKVQVVDVASRSIVKSIDVGSAATGGGTDREGNFFVLSQSPDGKSGQVTMIHDSDVAATYPTGAAPRKAILSADGKRLYVVGNQLTVVDLASKTSSPAIDAASPTIGLLATRDGRRVVTVAMQAQSCCRISVFDTAANKQLTSFLGGSKGKRIGQGLAAAALTAASYEAGRASASPGSTFTYSIYSPTIRGAARGPLAFGPGEKKAYAVDTQTNDITVVDVESGQRTVNIDGGSGTREVIPLPDAGLIAAISDERIDLIDMTNDTVREAIPMKGSVNGALVSPDEKRLVVYGKERIVIIDTKTGKQAGMIADLKSPSGVIFLK